MKKVIIICTVAIMAGSCNFAFSQKKKNQYFVFFGRQYNRNVR